MNKALDVDFWPFLGSTFNIVCDMNCKNIPQLWGLPNRAYKLDVGWVIFSKTTKELLYFRKRMLCRRKSTEWLGQEGQLNKIAGRSSQQTINQSCLRPVMGLSDKVCPSFWYSQPNSAGFFWLCHIIWRTYMPGYILCHYSTCTRKWISNHALLALKEAYEGIH